MVGGGDEVIAEPFRLLGKADRIVPRRRRRGHAYPEAKAGRRRNIH
jgi:hypothetical protein